MENLLSDKKKLTKIIIKSLKKIYKNSKTKLKYRGTFQLLIAVILSAQTTDEQVNKVTKILFRKYPTAFKLAHASKKDIEKIIKPTGYYKQKARYIINTAKKISKIGRVPSTIEELLKLDGVGRKTANIVLYFGYKKIEGIAVDTHCARVSYRIGLSEERKNPLKIEKELKNIIPKAEWGEYTNLMIAHGRKYCKAQKPLCKICPIEKNCKKRI
ncbi:MAG: endonuclease III [Candidatus Micrarchaeota archaeon]|nr:endonuclease III [Candidatus Micrarchaeota archaeon]